MNESSVSRAVRRWGERVILTAMVLVGFGIGTAGLALVGERWQDDPVVLDDPLVEEVDDVAVPELLIETEPVSAPETVIVPIAPAPEPTVPPDAPAAPEPVPEPEPAPAEEAQAEGDRDDRDRGDRDRRRRRNARRR